MCAARTNLRAEALPDSLAAIRTAIEAIVPVGNASHKEAPRAVEARWHAALKERFAAIDAEHEGLTTSKSRRGCSSARSAAATTSSSFASTRRTVSG